MYRYAEPEGRLPFGWLYKTYSHRIEGVGIYPESLLVCYLPSPGRHGRDVPALPQRQHREVEGQAQEGVRAAWRVGVWPQVPFKALNLYDWYWSQIPFIVLNICTIEIGNYVFNRKLLEFKPDEFKGPDDGKTLEVCESLQYHLPIEHLYISSESWWPVGVRPWSCAWGLADQEVYFQFQLLKKGEYWSWNLKYPTGRRLKKCSTTWLHARRFSGGGDKFSTTCQCIPQLSWWIKYIHISAPLTGL